MDKPKGWYQYVPYDRDEVVPSVTVFDPLPIDTGLLDADGKKIVRGPAQIGYLSRGKPRE